MRFHTLDTFWPLFALIDPIRLYVAMTSVSIQSCQLSSYQKSRASGLFFSVLSAYSVVVS